MYIVQILLPVSDNQAKCFPVNYYSVVRKELADKFGGITTYTRSPAVGLWKETDEKTVKDDIVIFELMVSEVDMDWWRTYRVRLEDLFEQERIVIRSWEISFL